MEISPQDWKLYRKLLPQWQEAYMDRLNREYARILAGEGAPSEKFWALEERVNQDKQSPGVQVWVRRSSMIRTLAALVNDGVITLGDTEGFSADIRDALQMLLRWRADEREE